MEANFAQIDAQERLALLTRLAAAGDDTLSDVEILEAILDNASGRLDGQVVARQLLATFGTLAGVVHGAGDWELGLVEGMDDTRIGRLRLLRATLRRTLQVATRSAPVIHRWSALMDYLRLTMGHEPIEQFRVLFLDHGHRLLADQVMQRGTINHTPVYPREIAGRALEVRAGAIILVHNHPSGDLTPSRSDINITIRIIEAVAALNIAVHDHVIIGDGGEYSFRAHGLLPDTSVAQVEESTEAWTQLNLFAAEAP